MCSQDPVLKLAALDMSTRDSWSDEELVRFLAERKAEDPLPQDVLAGLDFSTVDPRDFTDMWYLIWSDSQQPYDSAENGIRKAKNGYWKPVDSSRVQTSTGILGTKIVFEFYEGQTSCGKTTGWIMHEYQVVQNVRANLPQDCKSLCKVFFQGDMKLDAESQQNSLNVDAHAPNDSLESYLQYLAKLEEPKVTAEASSLPSTVIMGEILPRSLPGQLLNFQQSGPPAKIGFILRDREMIFKKPSNPQTIEAFATKKPIVECVSPSGYRLSLYFEHMVCIEFDSGGSVTRITALCWVDDNGFFFSPEDFGGVDQASAIKAFDRSSEGRVLLRGVRRCRHREARARGFLNKTTWAFGWYGAEPGDLDAAVRGGAVRTNLQLLDDLGALAGRPLAHGRGLHVSAVDQIMAGVSLSLTSNRSKGINYNDRVLYCAVAPGARELVAAGSPQSQPSSSLFHSGTDSLSQTTWYVFWDGSLGTSILPLYDMRFGVTAEGVKYLRQIYKRKIAGAERGSPLQKTRLM